MKNHRSISRKTRQGAALVTAGLTLGFQCVHAEALAYEAFDYDEGPLASAAGGSGFAGSWTSNSTTNVVAAGLTFGDLAVSGGRIGNLSGSQNRFGASRPIDLTTPGLLADDSELWFSVIGGYDIGGNRTNSTLMIVLGDEPMSGTNFAYNFSTAGATGLGVFFGRTGASNGTIKAVQAQDTNFGSSGFAGNVYGTSEGGVVIPNTDGSNNIDLRLVVGRITWGADSDTIDLFLPGEDLSFDVSTPHSTLTVDVDQSGFDVISFKRGDKMVMDELRFGASAADVLPVEGATAKSFAITSFVPLGEGLWEVALSGKVGADYSLYSSSDLTFEPGSLIENLSQGDPGDAGTVGGPEDSVITLDDTGVGLVRVALAGDPRGFVRAEIAQPFAR